MMRSKKLSDVNNWQMCIPHLILRSAGIKPDWVIIWLWVIENRILGTWQFGFSVQCDDCNKHTHMHATHMLHHCTALFCCPVDGIETTSHEAMTSYWRVRNMEEVLFTLRARKAQDRRYRAWTGWNPETCTNRMNKTPMVQLSCHSLGNSGLGRSGSGSS